MKLKATFRVPRLSIAKYKAALQEELGDAIAFAAFQWLAATTELIPVWSGASQATFVPLASAVGFQLSILPGGIAPDRVNLGLQNATGEINTDVNKGRFTFTYSTTLAHLIYNEFNNANIIPDPTLFFRLLQPGPYRFQDAGREAFDRATQDVRLPNPFDNMTVRTVKVK